MKNKREIIVKLIANGNMHNHRLIEFFAKKYNERKIKEQL